MMRVQGRRGGNHFLQKKACAKRQLSKSKATSSSDKPGTKTESMQKQGEFKQNLATLYLRNKLSAKDTTGLIRSAYKDGVSGVDDMATVGVNEKNASRDLLRKFQKSIKSPEPYFAEIPVRDRTSGKRTMVMYPFLLVHELLCHIVLAFGFGFKDLCEFPIGSGSAKIKDQFKKNHNIPNDDLLVPIALFGDGVPFQKKMSMEVFHWSVCSVPHSARNLFTCIEKQDLCDCGCKGRCTLDAILEIFKWSMLVLFMGIHPETRHDKTPWLPSDKSRKSRKGKMTARAYLAQAKGDWAWYKQLFGFSGWSSNNTCWRCRANKTDTPYWDPRPSAKWKRKRLTPQQTFRQILDNGFRISPLFSIPGFTVANICIDVLHAVDLGLAQEILGSLFFECLGVFARGRNRKEQVLDFEQKLKAHYKRMGTTNRINHVTPEMIKRDGKPPKFRAKGGETRHCVPYALEIGVAMHAANPNEHTARVLECIDGLMEFYMLLVVRPFPMEACQKVGRKVYTKFVELNEEAIAQNSLCWRLKPKLHLFMELIDFQMEELGCPADYWNYKDEDYVGLCASVGESRGGPRSAVATAMRVITRLRALAW